MFPFLVDPAWFDAYWNHQQDLKRQPRSVLAAGFVIRCLVAACVMVALSRFGPHPV